MSRHTPASRRIWRHNSYLGYAILIRKNAWAIFQSDTTTPEAKEIAEQIVSLSFRLSEALRTRVDP